MAILNEGAVVASQKRLTRRVKIQVVLGPIGTIDVEVATEERTAQ